MCLDCLCGFHAHSLEWEDCFGPIWAGKVNVVIVASDHNLMLLQLALQSSTAEHMTGKQAATRLLSMQLVPFHSIASRVTCEIQRVSFRAAEQKMLSVSKHSSACCYASLEAHLNPAA